MREGSLDNFRARKLISHNQIINGFSKSTSPQNFQLIVFMCNSKQQVDDVVGGVIVKNYSIDTSCEMQAVL